METIKNVLAIVFDPTPPASIYSNAFFILSALLLAGGIILKIAIHKKKKTDKAFKNQFKKYPAKLIFFAIFLTLYTLSRNYHIAFLSMRIFLYALMAGLVWLLYGMIRTFTHDYPIDKKHREQQMKK